jgi:hypothetical protein
MKTTDLRYGGRRGLRAARERRFRLVLSNGETAPMQFMTRERYAERCKGKTPPYGVILTGPDEISRCDRGRLI